MAGPGFRKGNKAAKRKGRLSLKWRQHLERELRKKEKEEKEAGDEEAAAVAAASAAVGTPGEASAAAAAADARARSAAAGAAAVAAAAKAANASAPSEQHAEANRLSRAAQIDGTAKPAHPRFHDLGARADAVCDREAWENAMVIMRERKCGWVHSRIAACRRRSLG